MPLKSMTGFARARGTHGSAAWQWEVRSVNGRGLDIKVRTPQGYEALEWRARQQVGARLHRGNVSVGLKVEREGGQSPVRLNEAVLAEVVEAAARVRALAGAEAPRADGLLALRGVLDMTEPILDEQEEAERMTAILASLDEALNGLLAAREAEGARLKEVLADQLDAAERLVLAVEASPERLPDAVKARLAHQLGKLLDAAPALDPDRLYQEAVLVAMRADVAEEIVRLKAHVAAARELLAAHEPAGRRLDFLSQELGREANTLCAKSNSSAMSRLGLELKAVIDQWREQVQNIE